VSGELFYPDSRPWTRWWWFNIELKDEVIRSQLDWLEANGFGGVELAFVYPLPGQKRGPEWLSREWSDKVALTKRYCDNIGIGCDFTFGTLWPFGGSLVEERDSSQTFEGASRQRLGRSWELPLEGRILNHLDKQVLRRYSEKMGAALAKALQGSRSALFCDSWEVETEGLWTAGFGEAFHDRFGYDVREYMPRLDEHPDVRYDYRKLVAEYVLEGFYRPFTEVSHRLNAFTRVQCHGAPTDLLSAYAAVDVPESEAILFDPEYSRIPASAAALSGKAVVSAEAFTCLYGWNPYPGPGPHQGEERVADMKLLADALFANGVNHIFWHGMPYQAQAQAGSKANRFYATVHVGPDSGFAAEIPRLNQYMERVCGQMKQGRPFSSVALYLPHEDQWMRGELPSELQKPSAKYHWEMHYLRPPRELAGYQPLWISTPFLRQARFEDGLLRVGATELSLLYVDCEWLDADALNEILRLAKAGLPVCLKQKPSQPGRNKTDGYAQQVAELASLSNVASELGKASSRPPLLSGVDVPDFWCRTVDEGLRIFFSHPESRVLTYPMRYGQADAAGVAERQVRIEWDGRVRDLGLEFGRSQSLLLEVSRSAAARFVDISHEPGPAAAIDR